MKKIINHEWITSGCTWPTKKELYRRSQQEREEEIEQQALLETRKRQSLQAFAAIKAACEAAVIGSIKQVGEISPAKQLPSKLKTELKRNPDWQPASSSKLAMLQERFKHK